MRWSYRIVTHKADDLNLEQLLNHEGFNGWECFKITTRESGSLDIGGGGTYHTLYLKKQYSPMVGENEGLMHL